MEAYRFAPALLDIAVTRAGGSATGQDDSRDQRGCDQRSSKMHIYISDQVLAHLGWRDRERSAAAWPSGITRLPRTNTRLTRPTVVSRFDKAFRCADAIGIRCQQPLQRKWPSDENVQCLRLDQLFKTDVAGGTAPC